MLCSTLYLLCSKIKQYCTGMSQGYGGYSQPQQMQPQPQPQHMQSQQTAMFPQQAGPNSQFAMRQQDYQQQQRNIRPYIQVCCSVINKCLQWYEHHRVYPHSVSLESSSCCLNQMSAKWISVACHAKVTQLIKSNTFCLIVQSNKKWETVLGFSSNDMRLF